jgi:hypothetical protein
LKRLASVGFLRKCIWECPQICPQIYPLLGILVRIPLARKYQDRSPATKAVYVDLKKKTVVVEPKDGMTLDQKAIIEEVKDAGYDIVKVESVPKSVAEIKAELMTNK